MRNYSLFAILFVFLALTSCKTDKEQKDILSNSSNTSDLKYAKGFDIVHEEGYKKIVVTSAWPDSEEEFHYLLVEKGREIPEHGNNVMVVQVPINNVVVTSTTNIPSLEYLGIEDKLTGFPNTNFISSKKTRANIEQGKIRDLGRDTEMNIELLLELAPELVIGFSVNGNNSTLDKIEGLDIPVVLDGSWTEHHPLGRAEWIKFIAAFFNKEKVADSLFNAIEKNYFEAKSLATSATKKPDVLSGSVFKDVWNVPGGESFVAKYLEDANTNYLWKNTKETGSLQLNIETVIEKAKDADLWIGAGYAQSKSGLLDKNENYQVFKAFQNNNVYTFTKNEGEYGGILYFELGHLRPDIILKDLISIAHPNLLPDYQPYFFQSLK